MFTQARFFRFIRYFIVLAGLCLVYGFFIEPKTLAIRHVNIQSSHWERPALKIGLIADIHIGGQHVSVNRVAKIVTHMNALSPDIILLAGDYVNGHKPIEAHSDAFNASIQSGIQNLGKLQAPLGVYAVLGNHDAWYAGAQITEALQRAGIQVLDNQQQNITDKNTNLCLIGLADSDTGVRDTTVFKRCPIGQNIIAFMHSPDSFNLMRSDTALALAGHTHGGQINIPLIGRRVTSTRLGQKYAYGKTVWQGIPAFVTAGIGTSILPARFRARPEIVVITLSGP